MAARDFLLDDSGEMIVRNGDLAVGDSLTQELGLLMLTNKGEIRWDPLCGCDLIRRMNSTLRRSQLEREVRLQVERDGKNWGDLKEGINIRTNG